ncbi:MAG: isochorismate synthase [Candidatus Zixiibacteriota bacterium]|jgi:menaquinone-specific isochorismate synthase
MGTTDTKQSGIDRVRHELAQRIRSVAGDLAGQKHAVVRLSAPLENVDPLAWLSAQTGYPKIYWRDRRDRFRVAGIGYADTVRTSAGGEPGDLFACLRAIIPADNPNVRYFGGFRFAGRDGAREDGWKSFGEYCLWLPRFEVIIDSTGSWLVCNIVPGADNPETINRVQSVLSNMTLKTESISGAIPRLSGRSDSPSQPEWNKNLNQIMDIFHSGDLQKIVLARKTALTFDGELDPWFLLSRHSEQSERQFVFGLQPQPDSAFIGVTPERLFRRLGDEIECEALAGTRPRGKTETEDDALGNELLNSEKDVREHRYVLDSIVENLTDFCSGRVIHEDAAVLKLPSVQHLLSRLKGKLRPGVTDEDILKSLHPTPAVGGFPREKALEHLLRLETFDRGWYAGPVGWVGANGAEFAVGIRSALVRGSGVELYAGAGIVEGSRADAEWDELENKISSFLNILTGR